MSPNSWGKYVCFFGFELDQTLKKNSIESESIEYFNNMFYRVLFKVGRE